MKHIIKKILKEESLKHSLIQMIKNDGWKSAAELVGGVENLKKLTGIETPIQFLELFNNMEVRKLKSTQWVYSLGNMNVMCMYISKRKKEIIIDYTKLYQPIMDNFNIYHSDLREIVIKWLWNSYKIKVDRINFNPVSQLL